MASIQRYAQLLPLPAQSLPLSLFPFIDIKISVILLLQLCLLWYMRFSVVPCAIQSFVGTGLVVHHTDRLGLVLVDRNTIAIGPCDVMLSFGAHPAEISARVRCLLFWLIFCGVSTNTHSLLSYLLLLHNLFLMKIVHHYFPFMVFTGSCILCITLQLSHMTLLSFL